MPGAMEHVEGTVETLLVDPHAPLIDLYVQGLLEILEKFRGKRVSITVEEVDE